MGEGRQGDVEAIFFRGWGRIRDAGVDTGGEVAEG